MFQYLDYSSDYTIGIINRKFCLFFKNDHSLKTGPSPTSITASLISDKSKKCYSIRSKHNRYSFLLP